MMFLFAKMFFKGVKAKNSKQSLNKHLCMRIYIFLCLFSFKSYKVCKIFSKCTLNMFSLLGNAIFHYSFLPHEHCDCPLFHFLSIFLSLSFTRYLNFQFFVFLKMKKKFMLNLISNCLRLRLWICYFLHYSKKS
jgi:hypothetical protein